MSVAGMIKRFGINAQIQRETIVKDDQGYEKKEYTYFKTEKILPKKPSDAWGVNFKSGNLSTRENIKYISSLDTEIKQGDKLIINLETFKVLKVSAAKEYSLIYLDRSDTE